MAKSNGVRDDKRSGIPWDEGAPRDPDYDYGESPLPQHEEPTFTTPPFSMPFDPVVRMALIRKGILTPEDLKNAEEEIRVTSGLINGG